MRVRDAVMISDRTEAVHLVLALRQHAARLRTDGVTPPEFLADLMAELLDFARSGTVPQVQSPEPSEPEIAASEFRRSTLDLAAAAVALGVSESMTARYCRTGKLPAHKMNGSWRIELVALEAFRKTKETTR